MSVKTVLVCCSSALVLTAYDTTGTANSIDEGSKHPGTSIYNSNCVMCHGRDGNLDMSGAKDLTQSTLSKEEMVAVVTHGRGGMASFEKMLSKKEIDEVVDHVRNLHIVK